MFRNLRNAFLGGLILLLPLSITTMIVIFLMEKIGTPTSRLFFCFLKNSAHENILIHSLLSAASLLVVITIITFLGLLSKYFLGKLVVRLTENVINTLPFINKVYKTIKQIVNTFAEEKRAIFQKVVIIEYPKKEIYGLGFLTGIVTGEIQIKTKKSMAYIFIPTTPNPTSGYLLLIPQSNILELNMSVIDGMKLIISGGVLEPKYKYN